MAIEEEIVGPVAAADVGVGAGAGGCEGVVAAAVGGNGATIEIDGDGAIAALNGGDVHPAFEGQGFVGGDLAIALA